jgi:hypothetical protein
MLVYAALLGCLDPILSVAAVVSYKSPFITSFDAQQKVQQTKQQFAMHDSDHFVYIRVSVRVDCTMFTSMHVFMHTTHIHTETHIFMHVHVLPYLSSPRFWRLGAKSLQILTKWSVEPIKPHFAKNGAFINSTLLTHQGFSIATDSWLG